MSTNIPKAVIITPTIGTKKLKMAVESVINQTFEDLIHLIIIDGEQFKEEAYSILQNFNSSKHKIIVLPYNTGQNGFNGHRIYAACSYLVDSPYVFFLDEDNWYDPNHVESLIDIIESENLDWAYSLRKIFSKEAKFITNDNCESLGRWPSYWYKQSLPPYSTYPNVVDTSCYALKSDILKKIGHAWNYPLGADRIFFSAISSLYPYFTSSSLYTLNYRLKKRSPNGILLGNKAVEKFYKGEYPWLIV
ncbi:glycosyltransferase family A protein [Pedobacter glucosidilyticus]|uniref:glycosyltransferase family A protein n=1 Tax=Pedobacter glucosidilyticus TaxID=1122941 RepID=UPI0026EBC6AB|nr:glycosyltransferase family A protein [Pedobacter glucosidilyticus]